ncbi:hypothetical protein [[Kitasatospora] papulosa]
MLPSAAGGAWTVASGGGRGTRRPVTVTSVDGERINFGIKADETASPAAD